MNPLEKEVPSLETCQELKWDKPTLYVWQMVTWEKDKPNTYELVLKENANKNLLKYQIPAPTIREFLDAFPNCINRIEVLPNCINRNVRYDLVFLKGIEKYLVKYQHGNFADNGIDYIYTDLLVGFKHKSPLEALSKMAKWLKKEGRIKWQIK